MEAIRVAMFAERLAPELASTDETLAADISALPLESRGRVALAKASAVDRRKALRSLLMLDTDV